MDPSGLVPMVQPAGGSMIVWGMFPGTQWPLNLSITEMPVSLSIIADNVHLFIMAIVYQSSNTSSKIMCHVTKHMSSIKFHEHDNDLSALQWHPQSPDLAAWMCSQQMCSICMMLSYQNGPESPRNVFRTWIHVTGNSGWSMEALSSTSWVYLKKWSLIVCKILKILFKQHLNECMDWTIFVQWVTEHCHPP